MIVMRNTCHPSTNAENDPRTRSHSRVRRIFQAIATVGDRQLVPRTQHAPLDRSAIDAGPVRAPQVADHNSIAIQAQTTMAPRDPGRGDPDMTPAVPAHYDQGSVESNIRMAVQTDQA